MSALQDRILALLQQPQLAGLATVTEEGTPWVRYVMTVGTEDVTLRCASHVLARKVQQISRNPEVHLTCGITDPMQMGPYLQIQGRAIFSTEERERHGFWFDMLGNVFSGPDDPNYGVIIITPYRIEYVTPGTLTPEVWTRE